MKNMFTKTFREIQNKIALVFSTLLILLALIPMASSAQNQIDAGIFASQTNANEIEIKVKPNYNVSLTMTNMQFTVRWEDTLGVNITPGAPIFPYLLAAQGSVVNYNGYNYQVFASAGGFAVNWATNSETVVATFTYNSCAPFEIAPNSDPIFGPPTNLNGVYYIEILGFDETGSIYNSPNQCVDPLPTTAQNPSPADGDTAQYAGGVINLGWDYVSNVSYTDPDSFRLEVGTTVMSYAYVPGQTSYPNMYSFSPSPASTVTWQVIPFNSNGDAVGAPTWTFVSQAAALSVDAQGDATICVGGSATLLADPAGGVSPITFAWTPAAGLDDPSLQQPTATPAVTTVYTVVVTDSWGQTASDAATITVNPLPAADAGADVAICLGECTDLTATGGSLYEWSNGSQMATTNVCPQQTTTYYVTVTDTNTCVAVDSVVVTVNPLPTVTFDPVPDFCINASDYTLIEGMPAGGTYSGPGVTGGIFSPTGANIGVHTLTYTYADSNGCDNEASTSVEVFALPTVDLADFADMCIYEAAITLSGGSPAGGVYSGTQVVGGVFDPATAGAGVHTITYDYSDTNTCSGFDTNTITVYDAPVVSAGNDTTVCENECVDLTATGGTLFEWSTGSQMGTINVCPAQSTTYYVTVTDNNGCSAEDSVTVFVNPLPVADAGADDTVCLGECATLSATGGIFYEWNTGDQVGVITVCPTQTEVYTVTVTDVSGCSDDADVTVVVNPLPNADAGPDVGICDGDNTTLTATGGVSYLWSTNEITASIVVAPNATTTYYVTVTDVNGCVANDSVTVTVNPAAIISQQPVDQGLNLASNAIFTIVVNGASSYQWQVSNDGGSTWIDLTDGPFVAGSTTATLALISITLDMDGSMYRVALGSPCGPAVISDAATLTVIQPPVATIIPNVTSCTDEIVIPIIIVKGIGVGAISLTIGYDDNLLVYDYFQNQHLQVQQGATPFTVNAANGNIFISWSSYDTPLDILYDTLVELVFHSPNGGFGNFVFDLTTPGACEYADIKLNILSFTTFVGGNITAVPAPVVTGQPGDQDVEEGQNASFSITATDATAYQWQLSDDQGVTWYDLSDNPPYTGTATADLYITPTTVYMDDYQYRCIVSGMCDPDDTSDVADLNVRPIITTYIGNNVACADTIIIPIHVTHFYGVSGISLVLGFNQVVMNYVGLHSMHNALNIPGYTFNINLSNGRVYISWYSIIPADIGDDILFELAFTSNGGFDNLIWDTSLPDNCQYNNANNNVITALFQNGTMLINPIPVAFGVTGGGEYCDGGVGIEIGVAGSETGIDYELYLNGSPTGNIVSGTGSAISFGYQTAAGTYSVSSIVLATLCVNEMTGTVDVVINPLPTADAGSDVSILLGTNTALVGIAGAGTPGYTYLWTPGGYTSDIVTVSPTSTTTYSLNVTDSKGCEADDDVTITVYNNTISGYVTYDNTASSVLKNVTVMLMDDTNAVVATDVTDVNGYYEFTPVVNGLYTVGAMSSSPWGGVNSTDALAIMEHFIQLNLLTGLREDAGDVDGLMGINSQDAFFAARRFVQLVDTFPVGDWVFEETDLTLMDDNDIVVDFLGLCYGDVNGSFNPAKQSTSLSLITHGTQYIATNVVELPISVDRNLEIGAVSLVLDLPGDVNVIGVNMDVDGMQYTMNNGELRISWYNTNAIYLNTNDILLTLTLELSSMHQDINITLGNESEIADGHAVAYEGLNLNMPKLTSAMSYNELTLSNYPNPFNTKTNIVYELPEAGNVILSVYNLLGDEVGVLVNEYQGEGSYKVEFDASGLVPGIYQYRLNVQGNANVTQTKTMVITE